MTPRFAYRLPAGLQKTGGFLLAKAALAVMLGRGGSAGTACGEPLPVEGTLELTDFPRVAEVTVCRKAQLYLSGTERQLPPGSYRS